MAGQSQIGKEQVDLEGWLKKSMRTSDPLEDRLANLAQIETYLAADGWVKMQSDKDRLEKLYVMAVFMLEDRQFSIRTHLVGILGYLGASLLVLGYSEIINLAAGQFMESSDLQNKNKNVDYSIQRALAKGADPRQVALSALCHCFSILPSPLLDKHAPAILLLINKYLSSPLTPASLFAHLIAVLQVVAGHADSGERSLTADKSGSADGIKVATTVDLIDLFLGWSLEIQLGEKDRFILYQACTRLGPTWAPILPHIVDNIYYNLYIELLSHCLPSQLLNKKQTDQSNTSITPAQKPYHHFLSICAVSAALIKFLPAQLSSSKLSQAPNPDQSRSSQSKIEQYTAARESMARHMACFCILAALVAQKVEIQRSTGWFSVLHELVKYLTDLQGFLNTVQQGQLILDTGDYVREAYGYLKNDLAVLSQDRSTSSSQQAFPELASPKSTLKQFAAHSQETSSSSHTAKQASKLTDSALQSPTDDRQGSTAGRCSPVQTENVQACNLQQVSFSRQISQQVVSGQRSVSKELEGVLEDCIRSVDLESSLQSFENKLDRLSKTLQGNSPSKLSYRVDEFISKEAVATLFQLGDYRAPVLLLATILIFTAQTSSNQTLGILNLLLLVAQSLYNQYQVQIRSSGSTADDATRFHTLSDAQRIVARYLLTVCVWVVGCKVGDECISVASKILLYVEGAVPGAKCKLQLLYLRIASHSLQQKAQQSNQSSIQGSRDARVQQQSILQASLSNSDEHSGFVRRLMLLSSGAKSKMSYQVGCLILSASMPFHASLHPSSLLRFVASVSRDVQLSKQSKDKYESQGQQDYPWLKSAEALDVARQWTQNYLELNTTQADAQSVSKDTQLTQTSASSSKKQLSQTLTTGQMVSAKQSKNSKKISNAGSTRGSQPGAKSGSLHSGKGTSGKSYASSVSSSEGDEVQAYGDDPSFKTSLSGLSTDADSDSGSKGRQGEAAMQESCKADIQVVNKMAPALVKGKNADDTFGSGETQTGEVNDNWGCPEQFMEGLQQILGQKDMVGKGGYWRYADHTSSFRKLTPDSFAYSQSKGGRSTFIVPSSVQHKVVQLGVKDQQSLGAVSESWLLQALMAAQLLTLSSSLFQLDANGGANLCRAITKNYIPQYAQLVFQQEFLNYLEFVVKQGVVEEPLLVSAIIQLYSLDTIVSHDRLLASVELWQSAMYSQDKAGRQQVMTSFERLLQHYAYVNTSQSLVSTKLLKSPICRQVPASFTLANFRDVFKLLLQLPRANVDAATSIDALNEQLTQIVHESGGGKEDLIQASVATVSTMQAAQYAVNNKLRTHYGGPEKLFTEMQNLVMTLVQNLASSQGPNKDIKPAKRLEMRASLQQQANYLLLFLQHLDLAIHSCAQGNQLTSGWHELAISFIASNYSVCEDWYIKQRDHILKLAWYAGDYNSTIYIGQQKLQDLHTNLVKVINSHQATLKQVQSAFEQNNQESGYGTRKEGTTATSGGDSPRRGGRRGGRRGRGRQAQPPPKPHVVQPKVLKKAADGEVPEEPALTPQALQHKWARLLVSWVDTLVFMVAAGLEMGQLDVVQGLALFTEKTLVQNYGQLDEAIGVQGATKGLVRFVQGVVFEMVGEMESAMEEYDGVYSVLVKLTLKEFVFVKDFVVRRRRWVHLCMGEEQQDLSEEALGPTYRVYTDLQHGIIPLHTLQSQLTSPPLPTDPDSWLTSHWPQLTSIQFPQQASPLPHDASPLLTATSDFMTATPLTQPLGTNAATLSNHLSRTALTGLLDHYHPPIAQIAKSLSLQASRASAAQRDSRKVQQLFQHFDRLGQVVGGVDFAGVDRLRWGLVQTYGEVFEGRVKEGRDSGGVGGCAQVMLRMASKGSDGVFGEVAMLKRYMDRLSDSEGPDELTKSLISDCIEVKKGVLPGGIESELGSVFSRVMQAGRRYSSEEGSSSRPKHRLAKGGTGGVEASDGWCVRLVQQVSALACSLPHLYDQVKATSLKLTSRPDAWQCWSSHVIIQHAETLLNKHQVVSESDQKGLGATLAQTSPYCVEQQCMVAAHLVASSLQSGNVASTVWFRLAEMLADPVESAHQWSMQRQDSPTSQHHTNQNDQGRLANSTTELIQYRIAILAYAKFLALDSHSHLAQNAQVISATLDLMRLLRAALPKFPVHERAELCSILDSTPTYAWLQSIPQLFALLHDGPKEVVDVVVNLLQRVAKGELASVLYPLVARQEVQEDRQSGAGGAQGQSQDELEQGGGLVALGQALEETWSVELEQIRSLVRGFSRVTSLLDEVWYKALLEAQRLVDGYALLWNNEFERLQRNKSVEPSKRKQLFSERYTTIIAPLLYSLRTQYQQLHALPSPTPHELGFISVYKQSISSAIDFLATPYVGGELKTIEQAWGPFKRILEYLSRQLVRGELKVELVAPGLGIAGVNGVLLPRELLGGEEALNPSSPPLLSSFEPTLSVYPTKTRPKKLTIITNTGQSLPILLKGEDDLRMDQHLAQAIHTCKQILQAPHPTLLSSQIPFKNQGVQIDGEMSQKNWMYGMQKRGLMFQEHGIVPLGRRLAMLQFLPYTRPLLNVYNTWRQEQVDRKKMMDRLIQKTASVEVMGSTMFASPPPPPLEHFHSTLISLLKQHNLPTITLREDWPPDLPLQIMTELMKSVPSKLLHNHIAACSATPAAWVTKSQNYRESLAVGSMIGYLLGIGDRHLDNLLFCEKSGGIAHVDFNVCLDKGKKLNVPEVVPCRLTSVIIGGLGPLRIEGGFRQSAEEVLWTLNLNARPLKLLLQALLSDPFVDWVVEKHGIAARKGAELAVQLALFTQRVEEVREQLTDGVDAVLVAVEQGREPILKFLEVVQRSWEFQVGGKLKELHQQVATAQSTSSPSITIQNAQNRLEIARTKVKNLTQTASNLQSAINKSLAQCQELFTQYCTPVIETMQSTALSNGTQTLQQATMMPPGVLMGVASPVGKGYAGCIFGEMGAMVRGLQTSSQWMAMSAVDVEGERLLEERARVVEGALMTLLNYKNITDDIGPSYIQTNSIQAWYSIFEKTANVGTSPKVALLRSLVPHAQQPPDLPYSQWLIHRMLHSFYMHSREASSQIANEVVAIEQVGQEAAAKVSSGLLGLGRKLEEGVEFALGEGVREIAKESVQVVKSHWVCIKEVEKDIAQALKALYEVDKQQLQQQSYVDEERHRYGDVGINTPVQLLQRAYQSPQKPVVSGIGGYGGLGMLGGGLGGRMAQESGQPLLQCVVDQVGKLQQSVGALLSEVEGLGMVLNLDKVQSILQDAKEGGFMTPRGTQSRNAACIAALQPVVQLFRVSVQLVQGFGEVILPEYLHVAIQCQQESLKVSQVLASADNLQKQVRDLLAEARAFENEHKGQNGKYSNAAAYTLSHLDQKFQKAVQEIHSFFDIPADVEDSLKAQFNHGVPLYSGSPAARKGGSLTLPLEALRSLYAFDRSAQETPFELLKGVLKHMYLSGYTLGMIQLSIVSQFSWQIFSQEGDGHGDNNGAYHAGGAQLPTVLRSYEFGMVMFISIADLLVKTLGRQLTILRPSTDAGPAALGDNSTGKCKFDVGDVTSIVMATFCQVMVSGLAWIDIPRVVKTCLMSVLADPPEQQLPTVSTPTQVMHGYGMQLGHSPTYQQGEHGFGQHDLLQNTYTPEAHKRMQVPPSRLGRLFGQQDNDLLTDEQPEEPAPKSPAFKSLQEQQAGSDAQRQQGAQGRGSLDQHEDSQAQNVELVPFTAFDFGLQGEGEELGGLEDDEDEPPPPWEEEEDLDIRNEDDDDLDLGNEDDDDLQIVNNDQSLQHYGYGDMDATHALDLRVKVSSPQQQQWQQQQQQQQQQQLQGAFAMQGQGGLLAGSPIARQGQESGLQQGQFGGGNMRGGLGLPLPGFPTPVTNRQLAEPLNLSTPMTPQRRSGLLPFQQVELLGLLRTAKQQLGWVAVAKRVAMNAGWCGEAQLYLLKRSATMWQVHEWMYSTSIVRGQAELEAATTTLSTTLASAQTPFSLMPTYPQNFHIGSPVRSGTPSTGLGLLQYSPSSPSVPSFVTVFDNLCRNMTSPWCLIGQCLATGQAPLSQPSRVQLLEEMRHYALSLLNIQREMQAWEERGNHALSALCNYIGSRWVDSVRGALTQRQEWLRRCGGVVEHVLGMCRNVVEFEEIREGAPIGADVRAVFQGFLALFSSFETLVQANESGDQEVRQAEKELDELIQSGNTQQHNVQALNAQIAQTQRQLDALSEELVQGALNIVGNVKKLKESLRDLVELWKGQLDSTLKSFRAVRRAPELQQSVEIDGKQQQPVDQYGKQVEEEGRMVKEEASRLMQVCRALEENLLPITSLPPSKSDAQRALLPSLLTKLQHLNPPLTYIHSTLPTLPKILSSYTHTLNTLLHSCRHVTSLLESEYYTGHLPQPTTTATTTAPQSTSVQQQFSPKLPPARSSPSRHGSEGVGKEAFVVGDDDKNIGGSPVARGHDRSGEGLGDTKVLKVKRVKGKPGEKAKLLVSGKYVGKEDKGELKVGSALVVQQQDMFRASAYAAFEERLNGVMGGKKVDINKQVGDIVREATDLRKLGSMYEGWMAWI